MLSVTTPITQQSCDRLPYPHAIVVKRRAAKRGDGIRTGERVDAASIFERRIREHGFRDEHPAADSLEQRRVKPDFATAIAEHDLVAVCDAERRGIARMDHHLRAAFARLGRWRLGEARIEERARRRCCQAEWMLRIR